MSINQGKSGVRIQGNDRCPNIRERVVGVRIFRNVRCSYGKKISR